MHSPRHHQDSTAAPSYRFRVGALAIACMLLATAGTAAGRSNASASAALTVGATVVPYARVDGAQMPGLLRIEAADVARGWVDVPGAITLRVRSNSPRGYRLQFAFAGQVVVGARLGSGQEATELTAEHAYLDRPSGSIPEMLVLDARLVLAPDAEPGVYYWPLAVDGAVAR